ncbi:MAG: DNA phosphorothioation-dependent restriction protein DptG [Paludibacteraceae bacterium]|nr:DNA phosphorothioation-dependent restriction protein DptG [Paludibacteraceae bacterium]
MITTDTFYSEFYKDTAKGKEFHDSFRSSVLVLPFTSNPSTSNYDRTCGLRGITGEFFRRSKDKQAKAIEDFEKNAIIPVRSYLENVKHMKEKQVDDFIDIMTDIMYTDGALTIINPSFLKFIPLSIGTPKSKKYEHGQKTLAEYLSSMLRPKDLLINMLSKQTNLFNDIIINSLNTTDGQVATDNEYVSLPFIRESFCEDLKWLLEREDSVVVKYIHVFLHFYLCYSISQTIAYLDPRKYANAISEPIKMYYILSSEHSSESRDAVVNGWNKYVNKEAEEKLFGRIQALDIINGMLGGNIGYYNDVYNELQKTEFSKEVKNKLEEVLAAYQKDKRVQLKSRENAKFQFPDEINTEVNSYGDFIEKLAILCTTLQSKEYESKMKIRINNIMKIRLLSTRRGREVLNLDDEMLFFLMAMISKGERMKLEDLYAGFSNYGILFDFETKNAIESYLMKLNLLERKSDSGEAQYVTIVL